MVIKDTLVLKLKIALYPFGPFDPEILRNVRQLNETTLSVSICTLNKNKHPLTISFARFLSAYHEFGIEPIKLSQTHFAVGYTAVWVDFPPSLPSLRLGWEFFRWPTLLLKATYFRSGRKAAKLPSLKARPR